MELQDLQKAQNIYMMKQKLETDAKVKMLTIIVMEEEHALLVDGAKENQDDIHLTFIYVIF